MLGILSLFVAAALWSPRATVAAPSLPDAVVSNITLASLLDLHHFQAPLPGSQPSCPGRLDARNDTVASIVAIYSTEISRRARSENRETPVVRYLGLGDRWGKGYYTQIWDFLNGWEPSSENGEFDYGYTHYFGVDRNSVPIAVLSIAFPNELQKQVPFLGDVYLSPGATKHRAANRKLMFRGMLQSCIVNNSLLGPFRSIQALSSSPERTQNLIELGFQVKEKPKTGRIQFKVNGKLSGVDFSSPISAQKFTLLEYRIVPSRDGKMVNVQIHGSEE